MVQPDLGTAVILGVTALGLLFVSGTRTELHRAGGAGDGAGGLEGADHRQGLAHAAACWPSSSPWQYCQTAGYQLCESLISVGSGGVLGQGLGQAAQKLFFLPEAHTDFILAIIGEELGLVGVLALMLAFAVLVWRGHAGGAARARRVRQLPGVRHHLRCSRCRRWRNMGVVLGLLPTKGLALPFISYGGTSLVMSLFMAGVLANISRPQPRAARAARCGVPARRAAAAAGKNRARAAGPARSSSIAPARRPGRGRTGRAARCDREAAAPASEPNRLRRGASPGGR